MIFALQVEHLDICCAKDGWNNMALLYSYYSFDNNIATIFLGRDYFSFNQLNDKLKT